MSANTLIIARPIKSGCIFNASGNPIIYKLRRQDSGFTSINNVGGFAQLQDDGVNFTSYYQVGNIVFIGREGYNTTAQITASSFSGGNTLITTDHVFVDNGTGYLNNISKRTDYRIEVEVFDFDTDLSLGPRISANPDVSGEVKLNISGIVSAYLSANWAPPITISDREEQSSRKTYIKFEEYYDGTYFGVETDEDNPVVCVFAMINLLLNSPPDFTRYPHGGNMLSFIIGTSDKLWLTRFKEISIWRGWPYTVSFLNQGYANPKRVNTFYNSSGEVIATDSEDLDLSDGDGVYRIMPVLSAIPANAVEASLAINAPDNSPLTSTIVIKIKDPCPQQVLLFWKNSLGGDALWMFDESQEYKFTYHSGRKVSRMRLYTDNLKIDEWDAINELNSPTDVMAANLTDYGMDDSIDKTHFRNDNQVFIVNQDGSKVGVIVIETENVTKTMYKKHAAEITIELPEIFIV